MVLAEHETGVGIDLGEAAGHGGGATAESRDLLDQTREWPAGKLDNIMIV
jgi:hypothetical protein